MERSKGMKNKKKVCFCASSGGHYEQLMKLEPIMRQQDSYLITEYTDYNKGESEKKDINKVFYLLQINRLEFFWIVKLIWISLKSLYILLRIRPKVVICTGVLAMIPFCLLSKMFGAKLIYIESFAKVTTPTLTGRILYRYADRFYVQWESTLDIYPNAVYKGGLY
ncbi:TPA: PssD/Cps14F family polysaccharide biosynthesis glycosyltransferase [Streptococcus pneumoniae]